MVCFSFGLYKWHLFCQHVSNTKTLTHRVGVFCVSGWFPLEGRDARRNLPPPFCTNLVRLATSCAATWAVTHPGGASKKFRKLLLSEFFYPSRRLGISSAPSGLDIITATPCISSRFSVHLTCGLSRYLFAKQMHHIYSINASRCTKFFY